MKSLVLHCLFAFLLFLGVGGEALAQNSVIFPHSESESAASLSRTDWHEDVASLQHQSVCDGMAAPMPSIQLHLVQTVCFLLYDFLSDAAQVKVAATLPPLAQRYYRNLFRLLRVINAP